MTYPSKENKYIVMDEDITIGCPQHGGFTTTPEEHLKGYGCPDCRHEHLIADLDAIFKRLESCIETVEGAEEHKTDVPVGSYQMVLYELSEKIKRLIERSK
tara:strand:- start:699 stop:1001 length:303 start_codon:yes stop_codon:yes gene_type:complete